MTAETNPMPVKFNAVALNAVEAWVLNDAPRQAVKAELRETWPELWHALEAMARFDGITTYVPDGPVATPAPAAKGRGLYALTKLARDLPVGPARTMALETVRRPYGAALAAVLIAAQLGSRSSWSGADELQGIGEVLADAGLPLDNPALYRQVADQFGIDHDDEGEFEDEEEGQ